MALFGNSLIGIIALVCAIWVIYDVWANNKKASSTKKIVWTVLAVLFSILSAIGYYLIEKK